MTTDNRAEHTPSASSLSNNSIAFIALCNEYCAALEHAAEATSRREFVAEMLRLLPRIYISATDLAGASIDAEPLYIEPAVDEDYYEAVRRAIETLMGPDDTYLEVFEEDMKYSDTPIAASIAEGMADLFQVFYNMLEMAREAPTEFIAEILVAVKEDFEQYWSRILCNLLRALNHVRYNRSFGSDDDDEGYSPAGDY